MAGRAVPLLSEEQGLLFRITHIDNVPWILDHGVHCRTSPVQDPDFREIGRADLIDKRRHRTVPLGPGGSLGDYVPFYFTPFSPMLLNLKTGHGGVRRIPMEELVILVTSVLRLVELGLPFVLTDRHAYLSTARFSAGPEGLSGVDWDNLRSRNFRRLDEDPGRFERYQAEGLVHRCVPLDALRGIACHGEEARAMIQEELTRRRLPLKVAVKPEWYF